MQVIKAKLIRGPRDGMEIEVPTFPPLVSVALNGDAEVVTVDEAADAVAVGHELYRLVMWESDGTDGVYEYVTLHELLAGLAAV